MIKDGTGGGYQAKVTSTHRLYVNGVTEDIASHHTFLGESYNINTGTITLSSANKSAVLYIKNNESEPLVINSFIYLLGNSDSTGDTLVNIERNPTGGTIVSGASSVTPINRDFGSNNSLTVDSYKGAEANTLTGGTVAIGSIFASSGRYVVTVGAVILRKGNTLGVTVTPPPSNTDMDIQIAVSCYRAVETTED